MSLFLSLPDLKSIKKGLRELLGRTKKLNRTTYEGIEKHYLTLQLLKTQHLEIEKLIELMDLS